ncbi:hypothetical protein N431DRAFT_535656 [Stipitochalara longipes BDJ]|nr:hypothetical protein N431DRAFT_535656 [Stipitochalara longipes BDJ]
MTPRRIFHPPQDFDSRTSITDSAGNQWLSGHEQTILINIHGKVSEKGEGERKAAYGIFFGRGSRNNERGLLPREIIEQSNIHEGASDLYVALRAVITAREFALGTEIKLVVLRTTSPLLGEHMDQMVWIWEKQGYRNSAGKQRVNASLTQKLHEALLNLENIGTEVKFWAVSRKTTGIVAAQKLCNQALKTKSGFALEALEFSDDSFLVDEMDGD